MREMEVLGNGHFKLDFADWKEVLRPQWPSKCTRPLRRAAPTACFKQNAAGHW